MIIKDVPVEICENCGEYYLAADVTESALNLAEEAVHRKSEVEILRFAA